MVPVSPSERVAREDLVLFINACFACSGQAEFYADGRGQAVSIEFLHEYILGNYRRLYARTLAAGINHFNQGAIIVNLLSHPAPRARGGSPERGARSAAEPAVEEGTLIAATLRAMPPQRAYRVLRALRQRHVNNRRARAIAREYMTGRPDLCFDAIKYRPHVRAVAAHAHLRLPGEIGPFLFEQRWQRRAYETPLFERFRQAHYSSEAVFDLPYTVAEGLAQRHGIARDELLRRLDRAGRLTAGERLRLQGTAAREEVALEVDLHRVPLTRLALYVLSLSLEERRARLDALHQALLGAARAALRRAPVALGRVVAVLDRSYSSSGSLEKRRRPLAVALAVSYLLRVASAAYEPLWTGAAGDHAQSELLVTAGGQTDLGGPLVAALASGSSSGGAPDLVVVVSDGFENDPPGAAAEVARVYRRSIDPGRRTALVHCNPVFDSEQIAPRALGPALPTVGLRDAEDLLTMLGFARFADGAAPLAELEAYLERRVRGLLGRFQRQAP